MEEHWKLIECKVENIKVLVKLLKLESAYKFLIHDMVNVWQEILPNREISARCKSLNKRLEAPSDIIIKHLQDSIQGAEGSNFSITLSDSRELFELQSKTTFPGGIPFNWKFSCTQLNNKEAASHFNSPLLKLACSLIRANKEFETIIANKDKEIRDYKESGVKVSRAYLETEEFNSEKYYKDFRKSLGYCQLVTKDDFSLASNTSLNNLLIDILNDSTSSEISRIACGVTANAPKAVVPNKVVKRRPQKMRSAPRGIGAGSDSDSDEKDNDSLPAAKKVHVSPQPKIIPKKKMQNKKKRGLF